MGNPGTSDTMIEMAAEQDPAMWAALQLTKETDPEKRPKTVGEAMDAIKGVFREAMRMAFRQAVANYARDWKHSYTPHEAKHSKHPWRLSFDDGEHPTIDAPIERAQPPGARVGVGVCQFHMLDVEDGGIDAEDRDGEQGHNMAVVLAAPEMYEDAGRALVEADFALDVLESLQREYGPFPEVAARRIAMAREALDRLDRTLDGAADTAWMDTRERGGE